MHQIILIIFIQSLIFLTGCSSSWKITKTHEKNIHYSFETPPKWMISSKGPSTILSRHGPSLERILISKQKISEAQLNTNLRIYPEILPHELGEVLLSSIISSPGISNVVLTNMQISNIDSRNSVNITADYQVGDVTFTDFIYAFVDKQFLYQIRFIATKRHYFNESLDEFNSVVKSFKVR